MRDTLFHAAPATLPRRAGHALGALLRRALAAAARRRRIAEGRAALAAMDDAMLADIGVTRGDIPFRVAAETHDPTRR